MPTDSNKLPHYTSFVVTCLKDVGHLINTGSFASQPTLFTIILPTYKVQAADPGGREVYAIGLRPLDYWNRGFESRRGHGCFPLCLCDV
jgi:hypothetical protein